MRRKEGNEAKVGRGNDLIRKDKLVGGWVLVRYVPTVRMWHRSRAASMRLGGIFFIPWCVGTILLWYCCASAYHSTSTGSDGKSGNLNLKVSSNTTRL